MQEPMQTWSTGSGPTSAEPRDVAGAVGQADERLEAGKSMSMTLSYCASASGARGCQSASLPWALRNARVTSSDGKTDVVTPVSAPMLAIVARCGTERPATPGPPYSRTTPTLPAVETMESTLRTMSFAVTQSGRRAGQPHEADVRAGRGRRGRLPLRAPRPARPRLWRSGRCRRPSSCGCPRPGASCRAAPKRSRWTWWQMPLPALE